LTILLAGATWLVALYQPIVVQKAYLTTMPTPAASPSALLKSAFPKSNTTHSVMAYLLSSISILLYFIFDGDTKTGFSIKVPPFFSSRVYAHSGHRKHFASLEPEADGNSSLLLDMSGTVPVQGRFDTLERREMIVGC
jgi:hypothetical protein